MRQMTHLNEYLSTKIDHIKADIKTKKLETLMHEFEKQYNLSGGIWANGKKLDTIVKGAQKIFGDDVIIQIWLPSTNNKDKYNENCFNCFGTTQQIVKDVVGLMPFTKDPIRDANTAKSLFYGKEHIHNGEYLPFLAYSDAFYVKQNAELIDNVPTFYLVKYYQSFM